MLREFLYVDTDKVRSLIAQLDEGVPEESRQAESQSKKSKFGSSRIFGYESGAGSEAVIQRSLLDAIFPRLEQVLEAEGALVDLSEELSEPGYWHEKLRSDFPPGSIVRITGPARLFDARHAAEVLTGVSAALNGFLTLSPDTQITSQVDGSAVSGRGGKSAKKPRPQAPSRKSVTSGDGEIEDKVMDFPDSTIMEGFTAEHMRAFLKLARGVFLPGLHLMMTPTASDSHVITARLQEGMRFLETNPEVLFARYGLAPQEWTIVGTIGAYAQEGQQDIGSFVAEGSDRISRARFVDAINSVMQQIGNSGLADTAVYPGFSFVPFAVYRVISFK